MILILFSFYTILPYLFVHDLFFWYVSSAYVAFIHSPSLVYSPSLFHVSYLFPFSWPYVDTGPVFVSLVYSPSLVQAPSLCRSHFFNTFSCFLDKLYWYLLWVANSQFWSDFFCSACVRSIICFPSGHNRMESDFFTVHVYVVSFYFSFWKKKKSHCACCSKTFDPINHIILHIIFKLYYLFLILF